MPLAIMCSGQGRQHPGMFSLTGNAPEAEELFGYCAHLIGDVDPRQAVQREPTDTLHNNRMGQILCTLQSLAMFETLKACLHSNVVVAGYSVGEVAAWGICGSFTHTETLELVSMRAILMDAESLPGDGLLFIRGLSRDAIDVLCAQGGASISIINPGDAYIVGGRRSALDAIARTARDRQASRVAFVPVMVASHTPLLSGAAKRFHEVLRNASNTFSLSPGVRLLSGIDGSAVIDVDTGLANLAKQISHTVQWSTCLRSCIEAGATAFLELGPGNALSEMVRAVYPDVPSRSVEEFHSVAGVRDWISSHSSG